MQNSRPLCHIRGLEKSTLRIIGITVGDTHWNIRGWKMAPPSTEARKNCVYMYGSMWYRMCRAERVALATLGHLPGS